MENNELLIKELKQQREKERDFFGRKQQFKDLRHDSLKKEKENTQLLRDITRSEEDQRGTN